VWKPALPVLLALALPAGAVERAPSGDPRLDVAAPLAVPAGALGRAELGRLDAALAGVLAAFDERRIDANEAVAELLDATAASLAYVAAELDPDRDAPADLAAAQDAYSEFAVAAQTRVEDAVGALDGVRANVRLQKRFAPFLGALRPAAAPEDAGWLASAAWAGTEGSGVIGAGFATNAAGASGTVRLVGPDGHDETVVVPFEASPRQDHYLLIAPRLVRDDPSSAPGDWRLELRAAASESAPDIVQIAAP
jgi:hypothetical protein